MSTIAPTEIPARWRAGAARPSTMGPTLSLPVTTPLLFFNCEVDSLATKAARQRSQCDDWEELLLPEIEWQQKQSKEVVLLGRRCPRQAGDLRGTGGAGREVRYSRPVRRQPGAAQLFRADVVERIAALHRIGKPMEVAGALVFLASPAASLITGHRMLVMLYA